MNSTRSGTAPPPTIGSWRAASVSRATEPGLLSRYEFRSVTPGVETFSSAKSMPRHHHDEGYATVVLAGFVTEVSFAGRMHAGPGDVFLHGRFDCHLDRAESRSRLQILRSLTEIAVTAGFSDLAHLSRSIRAFTGRCPSAWRARTASRAEP